MVSVDFSHDMYEGSLSFPVLDPWLHSLFLSLLSLWVPLGHLTVPSHFSNQAATGPREWILHRHCSIDVSKICKYHAVSCWIMPKSVSTVDTADTAACQRLSLRFSNLSNWCCCVYTAVSRLGSEGKSGDAGCWFLAVASAERPNGHVLLPPWSTACTWSTQCHEQYYGFYLVNYCR